MSSLSKSYKIGKREIVSFYENLLKNGVIKKNGSAYSRLIYLKTKYLKDKLD